MDFYAIHILNKNRTAFVKRFLKMKKGTGKTPLAKGVFLDPSV